jgi:hypothetical protein
MCGDSLVCLDALPQALHEPAVYVAFYVRMLAISGPLSGLAMTDVPDPGGLIVAGLMNSGLITTSVRGGVQRWARR